MPYFKFVSEEEREKVWDIEFKLAEQNGGKIQGLIAMIKDPHFGFINFYSRDPYLKVFDEVGIKYELIPREQISGRYVDFLRARYPELSDEL